MTGRWRLGPAALAAGCLLALSGCPAAESTTPSPPRAVGDQALPGRPTNASTDLPAYAGPPADAPPSTGPLTRLRGAVDLTPATPGVFARVVGAVAAPDGGAFALLTPADRTLPSSLVTVTPGFTLGGSVPLPRLADAWGVHALPDGAVAVTGRLADGYGFEVGTRRPATCGRRCSRPATGAPTRSPAGRRSPPRRDPLPGAERRGRGRRPGAPVRRRHRHGAGARPPRPGRRRRGRLPVPDRAASWPGWSRGRAAARRWCSTPPRPTSRPRIPTLLTYDAGLAPVGGPVRATGLAEGAETQSVAGAVDGTVFLLVTVEDGAWILGVPDGGGAGPLLAQLEDRIYGYALVVERRRYGRSSPRRRGPPRSTSPPASCRPAGPRLRAAARRPQPVPRPRRRADDRRVRHPARGHPDAVVPRP